MDQRDQQREGRKETQEVLEALLDALSYDELCTALAVLSAGDVARPRKVDAAKDAIRLCAQSVDVIVNVLLRIEASSPKTHCYLGMLRSEFPRDVEKLVGRSRDDSTIVFAEMADGTARAIIEKKFVVKQWQTGETPDVRRRVSRKIRHSTVVLIDVKAGRVVLTYAGFAGSDSDSYENIVESALSLLEDVSIQVAPVPARECVNALLMAHSSRVSIVRANTVTAGGAVAVSSSTKKAAVSDILSQLIERSPNKADTLRKQIDEALRQSPMESIALLWLVEEIITRVMFWENGGADFFVVWGTAERSFATLDCVASVIFDIARDVKAPEFEKMWTAIRDAMPGTIVLSADFAGRFAAPKAQVRRILADAVEASILRPVFRLKAAPEILEELGVWEWTEDLVSLRREFKTESGVQIDGTDPANIVVAFRR